VPTEAVNLAQIIVAKEHARRRAGLATAAAHGAAFWPVGLALAAMVVVVFGNEQLALLKVVVNLRLTPADFVGGNTQSARSTIGGSHTATHEEILVCKPGLVELQRSGGQKPADSPAAAHREVVANFVQAGLKPAAAHHDSLDPIVAVALPTSHQRQKCCTARSAAPAPATAAAMH
jgi:hypothetical protein